MGRLSAEMPAAYLSFDVSSSTVQNSGTEMSLLGAFDEALRQATRPDPQPVPERQHSGTSSRPETAAKKDDRDGGRSDKVHSEQGDRAPSAGDDAKVSGESESGGEDSEDGRIAGGQEQETSKTEEAGQTDEVEADEGAAILAVAVLPVEVETVQEPAEGDSLQSVPVVAEVPAPAASTGGAATPDAQGATTAGQGEQVTAELATGLATELPAPVPDEAGETTAAPAEERTSKKVASRAAPEAVAGREIEGKGEAEKPAAETAEKMEPLEASEAAGAAPAEPVQEDARHRESGKRGKRHSDEAVSKAAGDVVQAEIAPSRQPADSAPIELPQVETTEAAAAPAVETASTADPGTASAAGRANGSADGLAAGTATTDSVQNQAATGRASGKESAHGADAAKFVQRVANAFTALGQRSDATVRLKLHPAELGSLRMEITVKNGVLSAHVEAETTTAQNLLVDNLPALRERLAEQGIKIERFDVGVGDQTPGGPFERSDSGERSFRQGQRGTDSRTDRAAAESHQRDGRDAARLSVDGRLDVFI